MSDSLVYCSLDPSHYFFINGYPIAAIFLVPEAIFEEQIPC